MHEVYDIIAYDFDRTRSSLWPRVVSFLHSLPPGSAIMDVGCGNGKYLSVRMDCNVYACDPCQRLVDIARKKHPHANIIEANGLRLPYPNDTFDGIISIAVFHHLDCVAHRLHFLKEMKRVMKAGAYGHITVWGAEHNHTGREKWSNMTGTDYMVPWKLQTSDETLVLYRYYHLFYKDEIVSMTQSIFHVIDICEEKGNWHITFQKVAECCVDKGSMQVS